MEIHELRAALEAVLFAAGEPVKCDRLCAALEQDRATLTAVINEMASAYETQDRGLRLLTLEDSYQLCTKSEYADYIRRVMDSRRKAALSQAALEVLSVVAYNQPVTRAYMEQVRGVDCSAVLAGLCEKGLVEECGKLDAPGRPNLYGTTAEFLRVFGLSSIKELPQVALAAEDEEGQRLLEGGMAGEDA